MSSVAQTENVPAVEPVGTIESSSVLVLDPCKCDGCGLTRAQPELDDGWDVFAGLGVSHVFCKTCALEERFSNTIKTASKAFFEALLSAVPFELRRLTWDAVDCGLGQVMPEIPRDARPTETLESMAVRRDS